MRTAVLLGVVFALTGCGIEETEQVTLYRNSQVDPTMRIQFASFATGESKSYELSNCQMAARVLNANVDAVAKSNSEERNPALGFWCESGPYEEKGLVPPSFDSELPTIAR